MDAQNDKGETPLHRTVARGRRECARLLLLAGADAAIKDEDGKTTRQLAIEQHFGKQRHRRPTVTIAPEFTGKGITPS